MKSSTSDESSKFLPWSLSFVPEWIICVLLYQARIWRMTPCTDWDVFVPCCFCRAQSMPGLPFHVAREWDLAYVHRSCQDDRSRHGPWICSITCLWNRTELTQWLRWERSFQAPWFLHNVHARARYHPSEDTKYQSKTASELLSEPYHMCRLVWLIKEILVSWSETNWLLLLRWAGWDLP